MGTKDVQVSFPQEINNRLLKMMFIFSEYQAWPPDIKHLFHR